MIHAALYPYTLPTRTLHVAIAILLALSATLGATWVAPQPVQAESSQSYDNPVLARITDDDDEGTRVSATTNWESSRAALTRASSTRHLQPAMALGTCTAPPTR